MISFQQLMETSQSVAAVIISVALMLFSGFLMTRITKLLRLPNVTAYIVAGILIGPYCLDLVPQRIIDGTDFLSDIALAFIAFSTGEFFKLSVLKKSGMRVVWITLFEAVLASVFVFILTYFVLRLELAFSVVLAALASATAPASTMMTIRQTGAKGDFVDTLLQVVALDDVVGLVLYSVAISVALASLGGAGGFSFETLVKPVLLNLAALALGGVFGLFMKLLMPERRSTDNKLIISVALLFAFCCAAPMVLLLINKARELKGRFMVGLIVFCAILLTMLVLLLTVGKSAIIENIPMQAAYVLLFLLNFTNIFPVKKAEKAPAKEAATV